MNIITLTNRPKETIIGAVKRAVDNAGLYGKVIKLNFNGVNALVYPHESGKELTSYINQQLMIAKFPGLASFVK